MSYEEIPGYSGFLPIYDEAVARAQGGAAFVEVGVALGHSLAYLARKVIDSGKRIGVWGVDPWRGIARNGEQQGALGSKSKGDFALFLEMMRLHAPEELEYVGILRATSLRASRMFDDGSLDLVLVDGAHDFDSVNRDILAWQPKVKPGGILAGDDHEKNYPDVERACVENFGTAYEVRGTAWVKIVGRERPPAAFAVDGFEVTPKPEESGR